MAIHKEKRRLGYSTQQLFELIAQVERYPEFLPLWHDVRVSKNIQQESGHSVYYTDQLIQIGPLYKRFRTKTTLIPFHSIHIDSSDPLFHQFAIDWKLTPEKEEMTSEKEGTCLIEFSLNCVASSILLRPVFDIALLQAAQSIVSAFEDRAKFIYD